MVRLGVIDDVIGILKLIRSNTEVVGIDCADEVFSSSKTASVIRESVNSSLCVVAIKDDEIVGVCLGMGQINIFCDDAKEIQLLVNLVHKDQRGNSIGGRMFIEWCAIVKAICKDNPSIRGVFVGEQPEGTNINFEKRGFKRAHTHWFMEK